MTAFDNGLTVDLDRGGRILGVGGSPLHAPDPNTTDPRLDAADALRVLAGRGASLGDGDVAGLVLFDVNGVLRLGWRLQYQASSTTHYDAVVDAVSGRLLHRANFVKFAVDADVFPHYPGATQGGTQVTRDLSLIDGVTTMFGTATTTGPFARAFSDLDDDGTQDSPGEDVDLTLDEFDDTWANDAAGGCNVAAVNGMPLCSWNAGLADSWQANRNQNAIQAFWFVNHFRDHLAAAPVDFTQATGGFACARSRARRRRTTGSSSRPTTARTRARGPTRASRTPTTSTTPTWRRRPTARSPTDADVPLLQGLRRRRSATSTAATPPRSSTTSTRTA